MASPPAARARRMRPSSGPLVAAVVVAPAVRPVLVAVVAGPPVVLVLVPRVVVAVVIAPVAVVVEATGLVVAAAVAGGPVARAAGAVVAAKVLPPVAHSARLRAERPAVARRADRRVPGRDHRPAAQAAPADRVAVVARARVAAADPARAV